MKKIILTICDKRSAKIMPDTGIPCRHECKLIITDSETDEEDFENTVITLKIHSSNKLDPGFIDELFCPENQLYLMKTGSDELLPPQQILLSKKGLLKEDPFAVKYSLTRQEMIIMNNLITGLPVDQIANNLYRSYHTVKNHLSNIYMKLNVNKRSAAVYKYFEYMNNLN